MYSGQKMMIDLMWVKRNQLKRERLCQLIFFLTGEHRQQKEKVESKKKKSGFSALVLALFIHILVGPVTMHIKTLSTSCIDSSGKPVIESESTSEWDTRMKKKLLSAHDTSFFTTRTPAGAL